MVHLYKQIEYCDGNGTRQRIMLPPMVLADSAFGLEKWQMTPYKGETGCGSGPERRFNFYHSSARVVVEHAFGRLKGRFRLLLHTHKTSWHMGTHSIMAAMILHNFLGYLNDGFLPDWANGVEELQNHSAADAYVPGPGGSDSRSAMEMKQELTRFFMQQGRPQRRNRNR